MKTLNQHSVDVRDFRRPKWRTAFKALALPAMRMHNYRNLHRTMFYDAMCQLDCKEQE
jgi:hypothetical protein